MKQIHKIFLSLNTLFEAVIGVIMLAQPQILLPQPVELTLAVARMFGFAAIAISVLSLNMLIIKEFANSLLGGMITLFVFHLGLTIAQSLNVLQGYTPFPVVFIHGFLATIFAIFTIQQFSKNR
jgi:hypothetical protein